MTEILDSPVHYPSVVDIREPYRIAPDTWVIPELVPGGPELLIPLNSMVITGAEPVIVDTGTKIRGRTG